MKIRTILLTASAFALAAACTPAAQEPAPATPEAAPIVETTPAPSGPAAENTPDSLATAPAAPAATPAPAATTPAAAAGPSAAQLTEGRSAFAQTCAMCHGPAGQGTQMGVALTNGLEAAVVKEKIVKGAVNPGDKMPQMGAALSPSQLESLSLFVAAGLPAA